MIHQKLFDIHRKPIQLLKEIGRGGEGAVYEIQGHDSIVAKIYFKCPDPEKAEKVITMTKLGNDRLTKLATWPLFSIHNSSGQLVGFTMPKLVNYKPIFELYSPKLRLQEFPQADWRFLIHAAGNVARAFACIHESGHVIGDVNHGNLVVSPDATVRLIDTDSFQIHSNGKYCFCEVGVGTHQPPEMQHRSTYHNLVRTPNHDNFGLAVLIFQLLCLARHPFSGRFLGQGDMPIEKAISEFRFAYASNTTITKMAAPPAALSLQDLTPQISSFFEIAFSQIGTTNSSRPTAKAWVAALEALSKQLKNCHSNSAHYHLITLSQCPWCAIEEQSGSILFPLVIQSISQKILDIKDIWSQIVAVKDPGEAPPTVLNVNSVTTLPSEAAQKARKQLIAWSHLYTGTSIIITLLLILACYPEIPAALTIAAAMNGCLYFFYRSITNDLLRAPFKTKLETTKLQWEAIDQAQKNHQNSMYGTFSKIKKDLELLKTQYNDLIKLRNTQLQSITEHIHQQKLKQHLDKYFISAAGIKGISQGKISILQSYGIETAADIEASRLLAINGFGHILVQRLMDWQEQCKRQLTLHPSNAISPADIALIDREITAKRNKIEQELFNGRTRLIQLSQQIFTQRHIQQQHIKKSFTEYSQATADVNAVTKIW